MYSGCLARFFPYVVILFTFTFLPIQFSLSHFPAFFPSFPAVLPSVFSVFPTLFPGFFFVYFTSPFTIFSIPFHVLPFHLISSYPFLCLVFFPPFSLPFFFSPRLSNSTVLLSLQDAVSNQHLPDTERITRSPISREGLPSANPGTDRARSSPTALSDTCQQINECNKNLPTTNLYA